MCRVLAFETAIRLCLLEINQSPTRVFQYCIVTVAAETGMAMIETSEVKRILNNHNLSGI